MLQLYRNNLNPLKPTLFGVVDASSCRSLDLLLWTPVSMGIPGHHPLDAPYDSVVDES